MTREQFDAAELEARRQIATRQFDAEELRLLDYIIERSFRLGRTAAYFRSYRSLGAATELLSHAHETVKRLVNKNVLVELPFATNGCHWYGFNTTFIDWPRERKRPDVFWEEPALPWEPELRELLTETFIQNLSAVNCATAVVSESDRGRDAGPAQVPQTDNEMVGTKSPPSSTSSGQTKPGPQSDPEKKPKTLWAQVQQEMEDDKAGRPGPARSDATERTPQGYASAASAYPNAQRTPQGYSKNVNTEAGKGIGVPHRGTSIASSASVHKAELAIFDAVPLRGTETFNEKAAMAWGYLEKIDLSGGLKVKRFAEQWAKVCSRHPDYILKICPNVIKRQIELNGSVPKPLALLAHVAREDGKMR